MSIPKSPRRAGRIAPRRMAALAAWLLTLAVAGEAGAQERQVPLDEAGSIQVLEAAQAERIGVFTDEYPGFVEARLFVAQDSVFTLEVLTRADGAVLRQRVPMTAEAVAQLRGRIGDALARRPAAVGGDQDSRYLLLAGSTLLGVGLYGWAVPVALDIDDDRGFTGLYMLTASGSFFVPWLLTQNQVVPPAAAELGFYGGTRGFLHGGLLHHALTEEDEREICDARGEHCYIEEDDDLERFALALGTLSGVAQAGIGYAIGSRDDVTPGHANAITLGGDWGLLNGVGAAHVAGLGDRAASAFGLVGSAGGLVAGHLLGRDRGLSYGDVEVVTTAGYLGAFTTNSLLDVLGVDNSRAMSGGAMAGSVAGVVAGDRLVRAAGFSFGQATLVRLGTIAGALLGAGTGVILEPSTSDGTLVVAASAVGAVTGFGLTYRLLAPAARETGRLSGLSFRVSPGGVLRLASPSATGKLETPTRLLDVEYRF